MRTLIAYSLLCVATSFAQADEPRVNSEQNLKAGLVAYYPLRGDAQDISGNGHHGQAHTPKATTDRFGNPTAAFSFNGLNDSIDTKFSGEIVSVSFWLLGLEYVKTPDDSPGNDTHGLGAFGGIVTQCNNDSTGFQFRRYGPQNHAEIKIADKDWELPEIRYDRKWHHIVVSRTVSSTSIYCDGQLINTIPAIWKTAGAFRIGRSHDRTHKGSISDVRVYNRSLNKQDVQLLYRENSSGVTVAKSSQSSETSATSLPSVRSIPEKAPAVTTLSGAKQEVGKDGEIQTAIKAGDVVKVEELLKKDAQLVNSRDERNKTPLHWAASTGNKAIVELLLSKGADVNANDSPYNASPLHDAAFSGSRDVTELLLVKGANVNASTKEGITPLHTAASKGSVEVVELLIAKGANPKAMTTYGATVLDLADLGKSDAVRELLRKLGAGKQKEEFYAAAKSGNLAEIRKLLEETPQLVLAFDQDGGTPLHIAALAGKKEVAEYLLEKGADVNAKAHGGAMPLHSAAYGGDEKTVVLLLEKGALVNAKANNGSTPLDVAIAKRNNGVADLLRKAGAQERKVEVKESDALKLVFVPQNGNGKQLLATDLRTLVTLQDGVQYPVVGVSEGKFLLRDPSGFMVLWKDLASFELVSGSSFRLVSGGTRSSKTVRVSSSATKSWKKGIRRSILRDGQSDYEDYTNVYLSFNFTSSISLKGCYSAIIYSYVDRNGIRTEPTWFVDQLHDGENGSMSSGVGFQFGTKDDYYKEPKPEFDVHVFSGSTELTVIE